jgi:hypothetical protein
MNNLLASICGDDREKIIASLEFAADTRSGLPERQEIGIWEGRGEGRGEGRRERREERGEGEGRGWEIGYGC